MMHARRQATGPASRPSTRWRLRVVAILSQACLLAAALPAMGQQAPRPYKLPGEEVRRFATALQAAVKADNPELVAGFVLFPLRVNTSPGKFHFVRRDDFVAEYYKIFDVAVKSAILKQDMEALEQSAGDIAIGDGMVTAAGVCPDRQCATMSLKVTAMDIRRP